MKNQSDPAERSQALTKFAYKHNVNMVAAWHNQFFVGINEGIESFGINVEKSKSHNHRQIVHSTVPKKFLNFWVKVNEFY